MIVLISLSLIIPFLMILSAQKRNYQAELERMSKDLVLEVLEWKKAFYLTEGKSRLLTKEIERLKAELRTQELKVMRSCRNWSKMTQIKCAINPAGSCLDCRDYEVLGK